MFIVSRLPASYFGIKTFIAGFSYCEVGLSDGTYCDKVPGLLQGETMPRDFMKGLEEFLWKEAGWSCGDNKCAFLFEGTDHMLHALSFYDCKVTHVTWGKGWLEEAIPGNFHSGQAKVKAALKKAGY